MKSISKALATAAMLTIPPASYAEGGYIGLGLGQSRLDGLEDLCRTIGSINAPGVGVDCDAEDADTSVSLFGGYAFNEHFAAELGYLDLGKGAVDTRLTGPGGSGNITGDFSVDGIYLAAVGMLPLGERVSLLAKLGVFSGTIDSTMRITLNGVTIASDRYEDDGSEAIYGLGADIKVSERTSVRVQFERIDTDSPIDNLSVAVVGRF